MTGDEMERAIEFTLKNQAAFEARQAAFEEWRAAFKVEEEKTDEQIRALSALDQQTREFLDELSQIVARNSRTLSEARSRLTTSTISC